MFLISGTVLLLQHYASLNLSGAGYRHIRDYREWCQFLELQYQRRWKIHFAKKTKHVRQNVNYFGRYLKRPAEKDYHRLNKGYQQLFQKQICPMTLRMPEEFYPAEKGL